MGIGLRSIEPLLFTGYVECSADGQAHALPCTVMVTRTNDVKVCRVSGCVDTLAEAACGDPRVISSI